MLQKDGNNSSPPMTTDQEHCGLKSLSFPPMSCRGRTEAFISTLQSRLRSLASLENNPPSESSWSNELSTSPLREATQSEIFLDYVDIPENYTNDDCIYYLDPPKDLNENAINHALETSVCERLEETEVFNSCDSDESGVARITTENCYCSPSELVCNGTQNSYKPSNYLERSPSECTSDGEDEIIPRVRRCSSLKTSKTPPDTPERKKIVRFADVLGLDLADVRTFLDDIPKIPNSAYHDLIDADLGDVYSSAASQQRTLLTLFQQPGGMANFLDMVQINYVMLENAVVDDPISLSIRGLVRVRNLDFNKSVYIRYSLDAWKSFSDLQALYVENSCDGFSDKFSFLLYAYSLPIGQKLELAVRFFCKGVQYWDNNAGENYCFQCLPSSNPAALVPITTGLGDQIATFYYMEKHEETEGDVVPLTSAAVQDYIMSSLQKSRAPEITQPPKNEFLIIFLVILFSIGLFYMRNTILA